MATKIGDMAVYISANTAGLARDLTRASHMAGSFAGRLTRQMTSLGGSMRSSLGDVFKIAGGNLLSAGIQQAATSMKGLVASSLDLAGAAEVAEMKFSTMLGSLEDAKALTKGLRTFAAVSPVSVAQANESAASLLGVGVSKEQVVPTLARLSDLGGGDTETMKSLIRVYGQVKGMGKLQGQDWLQIANTNTLTIQDMDAALGDLYPSLAKARGGAEGLFVTMREQGRVTFSDLQYAIKKATSEGGRFFQMGEKYALTYAGKVDKLGDSWDDLKRYIGEALIDELNLKGAADDVGSFAESLKPLVDLIRPAIRWVGELGRGLAQMAAEGGKAFVQIADTLVGKLGRAFPETARWIREIVSGMKEFKLTPEGIAGFAESLGDGIINALQWAKPYWDGFVDNFVTPIGDAIGWIVDAIGEANLLWARAKDLYKADGKDRYGTMVKTQEEAARLRVDSKAVMGWSGLDRMSAERLVKDQYESARTLNAQRATEATIRMMRSGLDSPNTPADARAFYRRELPDHEAALAGQISKRAALDAAIRDTLSRGEQLKLNKAAVVQADYDGWYESLWDSVSVEDFKIDKQKLEPRLADLANTLTAKLVNPADKFARDLQDLATLKDVGRIDPDTYALAVADLMGEVGKAAGGQLQLAQGIELGSQQLATMVAQAGVGSGPKTVEGLLEMLNRTQAQALTVARQMAAGVNAKPPVVNLPE